MPRQNCLEKNLSYFPSDFRTKILALKNEISGNLTVEKSRTNDFVPRYNGKFLHSKYDPHKEAQTFCRQYSELDCETIVIFGFGFGYHVEELRRLNPDIEIIVFELVPELLIEAFQCRDFSKLLENDKINLVSEKELPAFAAAFQDIHKKIIQEKKCQIVIHPQAVEAAPPEFQKVVNALEIIEMGRKQPRVFNEIESKNIFENAGIISQSIGLSKLRNKYKDLPALVVGAGPSIDNTLPYLSQHQEKFIIIAVDAAMTALVNEGIKPDFIVTVDPQKAVFKHLANHLNATTPMFATPIAYHRLLSEYKGEKIFLSQENSPFCNEIPSLQQFGTTKAGSSVSCFTIDIALQLGCKRIFLTGLDSSFPGMRAYAKKAQLNFNDVSFIEQKKTIETEDIFGGKVVTHQNLYEYLRTIEAQIETSEASFFLLGALGARIEGARNIHQRHVQFFTKKKLLKKELFNLGLFQSKGKNTPLYNEIRNTVARGNQA